MALESLDNHSIASMDPHAMRTYYESQRLQCYQRILDSFGGLVKVFNSPENALHRLMHRTLNGCRNVTKISKMHVVI